MDGNFFRKGDNPNAAARAVAAPLSALRQTVCVRKSREEQKGRGWK